MTENTSPKIQKCPHYESLTIYIGTGDKNMRTILENSTAIIIQTWNMKFINFKVQLGTIACLEFSKFEFYKCKHNILRALLLGIGDNNDSVNFSSSVKFDRFHQIARFSQFDRFRQIDPIQSNCSNYSVMFTLENNKYTENYIKKNLIRLSRSLFTSSKINRWTDFMRTCRW